MSPRFRALTLWEAMRLLLGALVFILLVLAAGNNEGRSQNAWEPKKPQSKQAYVTLLYGDEFTLGVRVLGKSLRDTGVTKDLAVLVSEDVTMDAIRLLEADGWIVERIQLLANPNRERPKRFWGVYTKLKIFNMTQYEKIVYLDADTIVVKSIEDLFACQKFCANLKHSERLNSGVMVVEPSHELFQDMLKQVSTLYSYTGGDQGFLNSYYRDFPNAELFDSTLRPEQRKPKSMERLSTLYNADVGLYMLANKWMVDGSELRVVHYTLGPLKPWDWWTEWLLKPVDLWQNIRRTLENSLPGTGGGQNPHTRLVVWVLSVLPVFSLLLLLWYRLRSQDIRNLCDMSYVRQFLYRSALPMYSVVVNGSSYQQYTPARVPAYLGGLSIFVCFVLALISIGVSFCLIPRQVMPWTGLLLLYEWTFFLFALMFAKYLDAVFAWGRASSTSEAHSKDHRRQSAIFDVEATKYGLGMALLAVLVPCLPFTLGVTALFPRLGLIVAAGMVLVAFMTYSAEQLGHRWFLLGRECVH